MNKPLLLLISCLFLWSASAQVHQDAWDNYHNSTYQATDNIEHSDVTILYDRTYIHTVKKPVEERVELVKTVHRKIKINSLSGLEKFNKLYIRTFNEYDFKIDILECKAKTIKPQNRVVETDVSQFVTSTLPANAPFYYKIDGEVQMLAINDINIGDVVEYIYTTITTYETKPEYFYETNKVPFSTKNYCLEKSIFFTTKGYTLKLWPHNFHNGLNPNSDFTFENGKRIELKNIKAKSNELYSNSLRDNPYLIYMISNDKEEKEMTWKDFAEDFKPRKKEIKNTFIFNGESISKTLKKVENIKSSQRKLQVILNKINQPIEENFDQYEGLKNNIHVAWSYAKVLSKVFKSIHMPINFHFVVSKHYGKFDPSYVALDQFDNIILSFVDHRGDEIYMPLLEPYSKLNDIGIEFQNTSCLTIKQDESGNRTHTYSTIPEFKQDSDFSKNIDIQLKQETQDSLWLTVKETLQFTGNTWLEVQPYVLFIKNDSNYTPKEFTSFIEYHFENTTYLDSIQNIEYTKLENGVKLEYSYGIGLEKESPSSIVSINPNWFILDNFYTPYHLRNQRTNQGYLLDEHNTSYQFTFNLGDSYTWIENKLFNKEKDHNIGRVISSTTHLDNQVSANYSINYKLERFTPEQWSQLLELRDISYYFLNTNFYFKKKE